MKTKMVVENVVAEIAGQTVLEDGTKYDWTLALFEGAGNYYYQGKKWGIGYTFKCAETGLTKAYVRNYGGKAHIQKMWKEKILPKYENKQALSLQS